jgi:hypothetical protein
MIAYHLALMTQPYMIAAHLPHYLRLTDAPEKRTMTTERTRIRTKTPSDIEFLCVLR